MNKKPEKADPQEPATRPVVAAADAERYHSVFLAALTGFACNPSLLNAKHEELAAQTAERVVSAGLDIHPGERLAQPVV